MKVVKCNEPKEIPRQYIIDAVEAIKTNDYIKVLKSELDLVKKG